jgi:hypothetical protein
MVPVYLLTASGGSHSVEINKAVLIDKEKSRLKYCVVAPHMFEDRSHHTLRQSTDFLDNVASFQTPNGEKIILPASNDIFLVAVHSKFE